AVRFPPLGKIGNRFNRLYLCEAVKSTSARCGNAHANCRADSALGGVSRLVILTPSRQYVGRWFSTASPAGHEFARPTAAGDCAALEEEAAELRVALISTKAEAQEASAAFDSLEFESLHDRGLEVDPETVRREKLAAIRIARAKAQAVVQNGQQATLRQLHAQ